MNESELIRRAMSALGKRTSERKKISSRKNAKRPRKKKNIEVVLVPVQPKDSNILYSGETAIVYVDPTQFPKA